jgi:DNA-binding GntR family transcriptional regulator
LEGFNLRLGANRITKAQLSALEDHIQQLPSLEDGTIEEKIVYDRHFHFLTYETCHNEWLKADLRRYYYMSQRIWYYGYTSLDANWIGLEDHQTIVKALRENDAEKAESQIRVHIENFQSHIKDYL